MTTGRPEARNFELDRREVRRSFGRAARGYDAAAVLQARVRGELLERLDLVRLAPTCVLDLGAGTGHAALALKRRYPASQVIAIDLAEAMLREASRRRSLLRRFRRVCGDAQALPLRNGAATLVVSNLMLQWCNDPDAVFMECRRVLAPGGLLTFTTFGPDTLVELRRAWAAADARTHVNRFIDMHDLGDALVQAGFSDPVMDMEMLTLTYADLDGLFADLRASGGNNAASTRPRGLSGRTGWEAARAAYERLRHDGRLPASFEIIQGHAWKPAPKTTADGRAIVRFQPRPPAR